MASKKMRNSGQGYDDQEVLIDFVSGLCDEHAAGEVRERLKIDPDFAARHQAIVRLVGLVGNCPAVEPPRGLAQKTLARVRTIRQTEALIASQTTGKKFSLSTFSMRELAAVAAILILMVGLLVPSIQQARYVGMRSECQANMGQIGTAMNHSASIHNDQLPASPLNGPWLSQGKVTASNSMGLFSLVKQGYVVPAAFQCPCVGGQSFAVSQDMVDFPSARHVGYSGQYSFRGPICRNDPQLASVKHEMAILADATPVFPGGVFRPERVHRAVSDNHPDGGQNVLYLDWHVSWATDSHVGVNGDNIWLAGDTTDYSGKEEPTSPTDSFLLPSGCR